MLDIILITDICGQPKQQQQLDIRTLKLSDELSQEVTNQMDLIFKKYYFYFQVKIRITILD
jgi:hypothetical protein